jgi:hypothetical protein
MDHDQWHVCGRIERMGETDYPLAGIWVPDAPMRASSRITAVEPRRCGRTGYVSVPARTVDGRIGHD